MRTFDCFAALLAAAAAFAADGNQAGPSQLQISVQRLSPRAAVFYGGPWGNAVVALSTQKGIVVVDAPFSKSISKAFRDAIQAEFKRGDFAHLINSHEHSDHAGGNAAYADLPIVGHESLRREMLKAMSDPKIQAKMAALPEQDLSAAREYLQKHDPKRLETPAFASFEAGWKMVADDYRSGLSIVPPTITFDRRMTLCLGDVTVRLMYYGYAHSVADIIVSVPEENLVLTESLFSPNQLPIAGIPAGQATPQVVDNWLAVLREVVNEANENTQFIPGHGRTAMKKPQFQQFLSYLEKLWSEVRRAKGDGKTLEQAQADLQLNTRFPETADLKNVALPGTIYETPNIHQRNIEFMWRALESR
jgi:glyoxylase-like metal-dependent hydrolase (beta-lactamase superfamily II)